MDDYWNCIPPIVKYGYSISATAEPIDPSVELPLIAEGWEPQLSLQQQEVLGSISSLSYFNGSIWMIAHDNPRIVRFDPHERRLTNYAVWVDEQSGFSPSELFVSSGKELWGVGNYGYSQFPGFLSRYNTELDRFEPVIDLEGLLIGSLGNFDIDDDSQSVFWLVLPDDTVARFEPGTRKAEIVLDQTDGYKFSEIAVGQDDKIWLSAEAIRETKIGELWITPELVQYDPKLDKFSSYGVPPGHEDLHFLTDFYIDREGRIWVGEEWLEKTADGAYEWYALTPQPEFVVLQRNTLTEITIHKYRVVSPDLVLDASDGSMWFKGIGLLRLDPKSGEWCRVTGGRLINKIIEDGEGYLWISDGHQLYKKSLKP